MQDFISQFSTLTSDFESDFFVTHRGINQRPEDWQRLVTLMKKQTVRIVLRSRW